MTIDYLVKLKKKGARKIGWANITEEKIISIFGRENIIFCEPVSYFKKENPCQYLILLDRK